MTPERTTAGFEVRLRPRGVGRLFSAAFLAFWLCGWLAGECFAVWMLFGGIAPLELAPALLAGLGVLVWLALWTLGGYVAARELLRLIWSEDLIVVGHDSLVVRRSLGPFHSTRTIPRSSLLRIYGFARKCRLL